MAKYVVRIDKIKLAILFFAPLLVGTFAFPQSPNTAAGGFRSGKVVGGTNATELEFPFHVHLEVWASNSWVYYCGGVIYDETRIITTASAIFGSPYTIRVVAGDYNLDEVSKNEQIRYLIFAAIHPNFEPETLNNNIATVTVDPPFIFNEYVQPLRLAETAFGDPQGEVVSIGFGSYDWNAPGPLLLKATMNVVDRETCDAIYVVTLTESMVCASAPGKEICTNDIGGALVGKDVAGREYLAGIASWGAAECEGYPSVFTNIAPLRKWLDTTLQP